MTALEYLSDKGAKTEEALDACLERFSHAPTTLREAMAYSLLGGGKRLRPALALGAAELVRGDDAPAMPAACAIEMIHTYSLIHDDLPAMDDDDLRRGKPTLHKAFGEAMAILAGDALLTLAFEVAAEAGDLRFVKELAQAAGAAGMVAGQVIDLASEGKSLFLEELKRLHALKTGALIRVSVRGGAMLGGAEPDALDALTRYGEHLGLAFQITDDMLNVVGTEEKMGKPVGSDAANHKSTYPALLGLEQARELAHEEIDAAIGALSAFGPEADALRGLARFILERDR